MPSRKPYFPSVEYGEASSADKARQVPGDSGATFMYRLYRTATDRNFIIKILLFLQVWDFLVQQIL